jgi:hypothetical protein
MASKPDPGEDPKQKQAVFEAAQLATQILGDSEEFCKKIEELANLNITSFNVGISVKGLEPGVKKIRRPESAVKFLDLFLTGDDRKLAQKVGIKMDKKEIEDLKKAFLEISQEDRPNATKEEMEEISDDSYGPEMVSGDEPEDESEISQESEDSRTTSDILGSIGCNLHNFSAIHRILFVFGMSKISLFKCLNLHVYLNGKNILLLMDEKNWMDVLEKIFRSVLRIKDPEIKKGLLVSLEGYIFCVMKTVQYFEDFEN